MNSCSHFEPKICDVTKFGAHSQVLSSVRLFTLRSHDAFIVFRRELDFGLKISDKYESILGCQNCNSIKVSIMEIYYVMNIKRVKRQQIKAHLVIFCLDALSTSSVAYSM